MKQGLKVVKIIDNYKLVINAGSDDGILSGQKFLIFEISGDEVFDPDSKESLGFLELVKGTGKVTHIQPKMSTIESCIYESSPTKTIRKNPMFGALSEITETTESNRTPIPFDDAKIGDLAKRV